MVHFQEIFDNKIKINGLYILLFLFQSQESDEHREKMRQRQAARQERRARTEARNNMRNNGAIKEQDRKQGESYF